MKYLFVIVFSVVILALGFKPSFSTTLDINSYDHENLEYSLASPYHTVLTHVFYLQKQTYRPYLSAKALDQSAKISNDDKQLAIRLKAIFDGKGLTIDFNTFPKNADYIDSTTKLPIYYPFPKYKEIYLEKEGNKWYYSKYTVSKINAMYDGMFILGTAELASKVPFQLWQILSSIVLIVLGVLLFIFLNIFLRKILCFVIEKYWYKGIEKKFCKGVSKPIAAGLVLILIEELLPVTQLGTKVMQYSLTSVSVMMSITFTLFVYNLSSLILSIVSKTDETEKEIEVTTPNINIQLVSFLVKTFKVLTVITGFVLVLNSLTVNITGVLAGLSIGGIALALAAQDTVKNLFGSVMLLVDKPFNVNDYIKTDQIDGVVEEIGFRSTRIRTLEDSLIYIPNGRLADMTIDNFGLRKYRRIRAVIHLDYNTHTPSIVAFTSAIRTMVEEHPLSRKDFLEVNLNDLGTNSLQVLILTYFNFPTWQEELQYRQEFLINILELARSLGIRLAFPSQIVFLENEEILAKRASFQMEKDPKKIVDEFFEQKNKEKPEEN
ncbi:MAG: mechanosensitive ion channel family protein [Candidatus Kapabacteria bacterium]|nr:mechanosensitive ion channel family protein [Candidatus Kapabacteria bacterium]